MAFDPKKPFEIESAEPWGSGRFYYKLNTNQGTFYYAPTEFVSKGLVSDGIQFYEDGFVNKKDLVKNAAAVELPKGLVANMEAQSGYTAPNRGLLFTEDQFNNFNDGGVSSYGIDPNNPARAPIQGLTDVVSKVSSKGAVTGERFTYYQGMEKSGNKTIFYRIGDTGSTGKTTITNNTPAWARKLGELPFIAEIGGLTSGYFFGPTTGAYTYAALKGGQLGAQGVDPLEAGLRVAGTYAVANMIGDAMGAPSVEPVGGTPGVSEVYPVDMGYTAPGTPIPPIEIATAIPANQLAFPGVEIGANSTPVPGSFKATLPELGVNVPAGATAVPGSFAAALPTLLSPAAAASALSMSDVFRGARAINSISNLMGGGQEGVPQRQELPSMQATGVDLLRLPQFSAGTPNIASLLAPMRYNATPSFDLITGQSLLPPRTLSLLG